MIAAVVVVCLLSALIGYLAHGRGSSSAAPKPTPSDSIAASSPSSAPTRSSASASPSTASSSSVRVVSNGNGKFTPVTVPQTTTATSGRTIRYVVKIEGGMSANTSSIARTIGAALLDKRGWQGIDDVRFVQLTAAELKKGIKPGLTILVASPDRLDKLCAPLPTDGATSCAVGTTAVLNYRLWMDGVKYYTGHLGEYHEYMVGHEVGHTLGHGHQQCTKKGTYASIMQQQTLGLQGCKAWPWPKRPSSS